MRTSRTQRRHDHGEVAPPASGSGAAKAAAAVAAAGPRAADAEACALGDRALLPGAAQLEVGLKVAEGWDPEWLPGGVDQ